MSDDSDVGFGEFLCHCWHVGDAMLMFLLLGPKAPSHKMGSVSVSIKCRLQTADWV